MIPQINTLLIYEPSAPITKVVGVGPRSAADIPEIALATRPEMASVETSPELPLNTS